MHAFEICDGEVKMFVKAARFENRGHHIVHFYDEKNNGVFSIFGTDQLTIYEYHYNVKCKLDLE